MQLAAWQFVSNSVIGYVVRLLVLVAILLIVREMYRRDDPDRGKGSERTTGPVTLGCASVQLRAPERLDGFFCLSYEAGDDVGCSLFPGHEPDSLSRPVREGLDISGHGASRCRRMRSG